MTRTSLQVGLARGVVFRGERVCSFEPTRCHVVERVAHANGLGSGVTGVEAFVPRGAKAEYGLLVVEHGSTREDRATVEIGDGETASIWSEGACREVEPAWIGLPPEYVDAVADGLLRTTRAGHLRVVGAAHARVGSSPRFFGALAHLLVGVLEREESEWTECFRVLVEGAR